jgi:hypothetical protein
MSFMLRSKSVFCHKGSRTSSLSQLHDWDRIYRCFSLFAELSPYHCLSLPYCRVLISELMVTYLNDRMVNTRNEMGGPEPAHPNGNPPPLPTLAQVIALILESRDEQIELLQQLVANSARGSHGARNNLAPTSTTYGDFVATHPPLFTEAGEPLEVDHWLQVIESKFCSCTTHRCRRPSSPHSSYVATPTRGGPTTPPLAPQTTRCHGPSSVALSAFTTFQRVW